VAPGFLYFAGYLAQSGSGSTGDYVYRVPLPNGAASPVPRFVPSPAWAVGPATNNLYSTTYNVRRANVAPGPHTGCASPVEVIAPGQDPYPTMMAQDAVSIYWLTGGPTGKVQRLAK